MSHPYTNAQPHHYPYPNPQHPHPYPYPQRPAYPPPPQVGYYPPHAAAPWTPQPTAPSVLAASDHQPLFSVRVTKHTGLVVAFYQQSYTVSGTFAQCETALREAQQHNLVVGWWGVASLVLWNWIAITNNRSARKALHRAAADRGYNTGGT
ncbi:hypothetical protein OSI55_11650 [Mycobacterium ulcerans]|uniref:Transmembrane protein n=3 Tax=Mycobacterium ulcerans group TaxID=2993898 RepID=A0A9N7LWH4_9MYCO|nr:conserved transmembrane protein [Mycobacterium marinum DL240490]MEB3920133.1 hypothetical protein [Mycobacterium ulcerans]CAE46828.1 possible conserved transmembrane protein [Mycobacterium ulcerans Agy99]BDN85371.1 hypothetical protein NJB1907Z4_P0230 [Mycobacterium pseudoshottsii]MEB4028051.1 hypothetical protein [Mycobacterium ulcerans]